MKQNTFLSLGWKDFAKGLIMAVGGAVFAVIQTSLEAGQFQINWKQVASVAAATACVYLGKNLFTNSQDQFAKPEPKP